MFAIDMKNLTVLITCAGGEYMPYVLTSTRESLLAYGVKIKLICVDVNENAIGQYFCDKFYQVPSGNDDNYLKVLLTIINSDKVDFIIPTADEEAISLASSQAELQRFGCQAICPDATAIETITDKFNTYQYLKKNTCNTVEFEKIVNLKQLNASLKNWHERHACFVIKPCRDRGGRGVYCINSEPQEESSKARQSSLTYSEFMQSVVTSNQLNYPLLIMQALNGPVCDADVLLWHNEIIRIITRQRIDPYFPNQGHVFFSDESISNEVKKALSGLNLNGLYDIDIMFRQDEQPVIIEINPRPSGSFAVSLAAGVPLLTELILLAINQPVSTTNINQGCKVVPYKALKVVE